MAVPAFDEMMFPLLSVIPSNGALEKKDAVKRIEPEFADLFYAYGVLDSGRFIGESSHLVGLGSNQASFYLRA